MEMIYSDKTILNSIPMLVIITHLQAKTHFPGALAVVIYFLVSVGYPPYVHSLKSANNSSHEVFKFIAKIKIIFLSTTLRIQNNSLSVNGFYFFKDANVKKRMRLAEIVNVNKLKHIFHAFTLFASRQT